MSETIDQLTVDYFEGSTQTTKELDKVVLTRGAWTTILFKYQNLDKKTETFGPIAYTIRRYKKQNGEYRLNSKFNISNQEQAEKIISTLSGWIEKDKNN